VIYALYAFLLLYALWVFYLAVMNLQRARDAGLLKGFAYPLGYLTLFIGLALDFLSNVLVLTVILLELPKETTVTARLKRHVKNKGYRGAVARWFGAVLLDPFDPSGNHLD